MNTIYLDKLAQMYAGLAPKAANFKAAVSRLGLAEKTYVVNRAAEYKAKAAVNKGGPVAPSAFQNVIKGQIRAGNAAQMAMNMPPKMLDRSSFNQARMGVAARNNMQAAFAMNPMLTKVPAVLTTPATRFGTAAQPTFTRPPAVGASIRALPLPKYPGGGVPKLLPQFTPKAMGAGLPASLAARNVPGPRGSTLTAAQGMFQTAPPAQRGLPSTIEVASPAGRYFRRSPAFIAALSGISGSFSDAQADEVAVLGEVEEFRPSIRTVPLNGFGEVEPFRPSIRTVTLTGLGVVGAGSSSGKQEVAVVTLPSPAQLKQSRKAKGLNGFDGLAALGDVKAVKEVIKANFGLIVDIAIVPSAEFVIKKIQGLDFYKKNKEKADALLGGLGYDVATQKLDPNGVAMKLIKTKMTDLAFTNLSRANDVFNKINDVLDAVSLPVLGFPRNFKKEVIKQVWSEVYGGAAGAEPSPEILTKMETDLASVQDVDTVSQKISTTAAYAPSAANPAAPPSSTTLNTGAPAPGTALPPPSAGGMDTKTMLMIGGGVVAVGAIAFFALRK